MTLYLVRHGRPLIDRTRPAHEWPLDPAYADDVRAVSSRLPDEAVWYSSPEPKALGTARLLTDGRVEVVADLREHERRSSAWTEDFEMLVRRSFEQPEFSAYDGWEPLAKTRARVVRAVATILDAHPSGHVVLVGHGTAWTLVGSALSGDDPDLGRWARLAMPDVLEYPSVQGAGDMLGP